MGYQARDGRPAAKYVWILLTFAAKFAAGYDINSDVCGVAPLTRVASARIVNGSVSQEGAWPWQVLVLDNGEQICGASLIAEEWIITAAHCIIGDVNLFTLYAGTYHINASGSNAKEVVAHLYLCHKDYNNETFDNDVCLIKLTEPVDFTDYIVPACLPSRGTTVAVGESVTVTGWGETMGTGSNDQLREAEVLILSTNDCKSWYGSANILIPDKHFCAGYQTGQIDSCQGDSGGPLVHKEIEFGRTAYVLRGITSFGQGCAQAERPGVYVQVSEYLDWIDERMNAVSGSFCRPTQSGVCGGVVKESGTIRSPAFAPNFAYPASTSCEWTVLAPPGFWIRFTFTCYFLLSPAGKDCDDSVTISNSTGGTEKAFCGNELPEPFLFEGISASLKFTSNEELQYPGFVVDVEFVAQTSQSATTETVSTQSIKAFAVDGKMHRSIFLATICCSFAVIGTGLSA